MQQEITGNLQGSVYQNSKNQVLLILMSKICLLCVIFSDTLHWGSNIYSPNLDFYSLTKMNNKSFIPNFWPWKGQFVLYKSIYNCIFSLLSQTMRLLIFKNITVWLLIDPIVNKQWSFTSENPPPLVHSPVWPCIYHSALNTYVSTKSDENLSHYPPELEKYV